MGQNENIMDNNFENFEDTTKYKSLSVTRRKQANIWGIVSMLLYAISSICLLICYLKDFLGIQTNAVTYEFEVGIILFLISVVVAIIGYKIQKTKITEMMILGTLGLLVMGGGTIILLFGGIWLLLGYMKG